MITKEPWGSTPEGEVERYTLTGGDGIVVRLLTYGGIVQSVEVPDRDEAGGSEPCSGGFSGGSTLRRRIDGGAR